MVGFIRVLLDSEVKMILNEKKGFLVSSFAADMKKLHNEGKG